MILIIIAILDIMAIIYIKLKYDFSHTIKHTKEWGYMALGAIPAITIFTFESNLVWYYALPLSCLMCAGTILFWFNGLFNVLRKPKQKWFFTGTKWKGQSFSDKVFSAMPKWLQITVELILFIAPLITYILTFKAS